MAEFQSEIDTQIRGSGGGRGGTKEVTCFVEEILTSLLKRSSRYGRVIPLKQQELNTIEFTRFFIIKLQNY